MLCFEGRFCKVENIAAGIVSKTQGVGRTQRERQHLWKEMTDDILGTDPSSD